MMVRIHTSRWGFYVISGLLCLSIPFLTVISLRHRLNLYLVEEESDPHFNPDITTPLKDGSTPRLATISWSQAALSAPTASVTAVDAAIGEETSEDDQAPPTTSNAAVLPVAPEAAVKSTAEEPAPSASGHAPAISDYNYTLSQAECSAQFPNLYREIDRAVAFRRQIGNVPPSEIDTSWKSSGAVRAMIYNQKLYILEAKFSGSGYHRTRGLGVLQQIDRAILTSPFPIPDIEFSFTIADIPDESHAHHTLWSFSRQAVDEELWLMPDFGYWAWPVDLVGEYAEVRMEMQQNEVPWEEKIPKVLWRGAVKTNEEIRGALMRVTEGKEWADVKEVTWKNRTEVASSAAVPIADHCGYQFLMHTEGQSYSGRGKYLLNCESVTIVHKPIWIEPHQHLYISSGPQQNVVEVERDFSDLEEKIEDLLRDPERAKTIAKNSVATFRDKYLTPAAQACYWRQLLVAWAEVSFVPEAWETVRGRKQLRGVAFESFTIKELPQPVKSCSWWKSITFQC